MYVAYFNITKNQTKKPTKKPPKNHHPKHQKNTKMIFCVFFFKKDFFYQVALRLPTRKRRFDKNKIK